MNPLLIWLRIAARPTIVWRGLMYALIVGPLLIAINHIDALVRGDLDAVRLLKMALTFLVPYLVSTFSSVGAIRAMQRNGETSR